jgi:hypothetical protein
MTPRRTLFLALALCPVFRAGAQQPDIPGLSRQDEGLIESVRETNEAEARTAQELQAKAFAAIQSGKLADAEGFLREQLKHDGKNFVIYYNLACVKSLQGDGPGAGDMLLKAVENGFIDIYQLRRDPQLGAARKDAAYRNLVDAWPRILDQHLEANLKQAGRIFSGKNGRYTTTRDDRLRVAYMSAMDAQSTDAAREDIGRLYDWGLQSVFADLAAPGAGDGDAWVVVVLPSPRDFLKWAVAMYGAAAMNNFAAIGGSYIHDQKRLVSQDLGSSLRHEFFHVLHWRSMTRLGQLHPIWIQEGLCSLVEDYDCPGGKAESLKPVPSWRSNIVGRLARAGRLAPLKQIAGYSQDRFTGSSPLANYAQARTFFLYLSDRGKLKDWYTWYTAHFEDDPTGIASIEHALGEPIEQVDKDYRAWARALPEVAEQIRPGHAGLGVDVEAGTGDGPVIVEIPRDRRSRTPNPAAAAGLRVGDVITAIDRRPTRDLNELVRLLGEHSAGDEVEVSYRRGAQHGSAKVKLSPQ